MCVKMDLKIILSTLFITSLICGLIMADKTTVERIRKHQEWLKQRHQGRNNLLSTAKPKKSIELLNLWRFNKNEYDNNSVNEVYPENDNILSKTTALTATENSSTTPTTTTIGTKLPTTATTAATVATNTSASTTATQRPATYTDSVTAATTVKYFVAPFHNPIPRVDSNFHIKTSTTKEWLSNDILETTTPLASTTTSTTSATPSINTTTAITTTTSTTTKTTTTRKPKPRPYPRWSNWAEWSDCSRSCGGGIKHQLRKCVNRWLRCCRRLQIN